MATHVFHTVYSFRDGTIDGEPGRGAQTYRVDAGGATPDTRDTNDTFVITEGGSGDTIAATCLGQTDNGEPVFLVIGSTVGGIGAGDEILLSDIEAQAIGLAVNVNGATDSVVCFAEGTLIATPAGERAVEVLETGDVVTTADGRAVKVKWVGRQTVHRLFAGERAVPVRVTAGALGRGLPHADLVLTADHALVLDGLAVTASALVNGATVVWDHEVPDRATYYNIKTESHDIILTNGTPAESHVEDVCRGVYDNHPDFVALYGETLTLRETDMPRVSVAHLLPASIRARLAASRNASRAA